MHPVLRQILTGKDNATHDVGRWFAAAGGSTGIALAVYDVVINHKEFDMLKFGLGMAALAAGVGAMLKLKADTEPKESP